LLDEGDERAPVCTDCHTGHEITHASIPGSTLDIVRECGECHDRPEMLRGRRVSFYDTYRASYHGQVNELGSTRAARCSDCHGAHDILPIADENSRLHGEHRIEACRTCHEGANARFAQFDPHADYRDRQRYPVLYGVWWYFIIMMSGAFGFFGLHSVLWFIRSLLERRRNGPSQRFTANPHGISRFTALNRVNHAFVIITFFGLTLTGLPLLFSEQEWAKRLAWLLGGVYAAGIWHRVFAVMLMGNFLVHFYGLVRSARRHGRSVLRTWAFGPNSMVPRGRDLRDCAGMIRWFFRGGKKPSFDRWTYWEKFDYWAEIGGTMIIGGSGLMLWFPKFFSSFLPGWLFNVAMIVHGYEALLAVGFIFTIHFFNAHLRLEKFPVDDVIFTGQLPEEEFRHERGDEYARALQSGQLEAMRVAPAPKWQRRLAVVVGTIAMAIGTTLVTLIILAGLGVL
jgi:cytochrome b subunit of formate dehydrogenase